MGSVLSINAITTSCRQRTFRDYLDRRQTQLLASICRCLLVSSEAPLCETIRYIGHNVSHPSDGRFPSSVCLHHASPPWDPSDTSHTPQSLSCSCDRS